jgi:DNA (cytosine-5)-methyltransferase 1
MDLGFEGGFEILEESIHRRMNGSWVDSETRPGFIRLKSLPYEIIFANDILPAAKKTWINNFSRSGINTEIFRSESIVDIVKSHQTGSSVLPKSCDIITGGFPCQDFSVAGKRKGFNSHKGHHGDLLNNVDNPTEENRGKLYMWMRHVIEITQPKMFLAENVKGLVSLADARGIIQSDFESISDNGYLVLEVPVLKAYEYGVPQSRERVVFIGLKRDALRKSVLDKISSGLPIDLSPYPEITHSLDPNSTLSSAVSCRVAFRGLNEPEESNDPDQQTYSKAKWYGRHCQGQSEIKLDAIGPTIRAEHHGNIEFRRLSAEHGGVNREEIDIGLGERRLTVRECSRIQTFPDSFSFVNKTGPHRVSGSEAYKVIGNAVPPLLAYHLAHKIQLVWSKIFKC